MAAKFPPNFMWGVGTSSYQIEGAWDKDGKTAHIWDTFVHDSPTKISDRSTGDVACDSYNNVERDVEMLKEINVSHYRFSVSWPRILPDGTKGHVNEKGVQYYDRLIDALRKNGIEPVITLYHWDFPQALQDRGGWANKEIVQWFADFAAVCYEAFADRVHLWVTINEPWVNTWFGHDEGTFAPCLTSEDGSLAYKVVYHQLLAHATAYRLYKKSYQGRIGLVVNCTWALPADEDSEGCRRASRVSFEHQVGLYMHPIYGDGGGWPGDIERIIGEKSEGSTSRLPTLTEGEKKLLLGSSDYFGLNYYHTVLTAPHLEGQANHRYSDGQPKGYKNRRDRDSNSVHWYDKSWHIHGPPGSWLSHVPYGFNQTLHHIRRLYNNPPIIIMENGCASMDDEVDLDDHHRIRYMEEHLLVLRKAIKDGCDIDGYFAWSLMDNFEWASGYDYKFGLFHVDMADAKRRRTARKSVAVYRRVIESNGASLDE